MALKNCSDKLCNDSVQLQMEIRILSRRRSRSPDYEEFNLFISSSFFAEDGKEMYKDL